MANETLYIKHSGGDWNIRTVPSPAHSPVGSLKRGHLFAYTNGARWEGQACEMYAGQHKVTNYAKINLTFFNKTGYYTSLYGAYNTIIVKPSSTSHGSGSQYVLSGNTQCYNNSNRNDDWLPGDSGIYMYATTKTFHQHIKDSLRAGGWNGSSNHNGTFGHFCQRNGWIGVKVKYTAGVYDGGAAQVDTLSPGHWIFFNDSMPAVNGSSRKDWVRIAGYVKGTNPMGTIQRYNITSFFNADLDFQGSGPAGYNMYVFRTDGEY